MKGQSLTTLRSYDEAFSGSADLAETAKLKGPGLAHNAGTMVLFNCRKIPLSCVLCADVLVSASVDIETLSLGKKAEHGKP